MTLPVFGIIYGMIFYITLICVILKKIQITQYIILLMVPAFMIGFRIFKFDELFWVVNLLILKNNYLIYSLVFLVMLFFITLIVTLHTKDVKKLFSEFSEKNSSSSKKLFDNFLLIFSLTAIVSGFTLFNLKLITSSIYLLNHEDIIKQVAIKKFDGVKLGGTTGKYLSYMEITDGNLNDRIYLDHLREINDSNWKVFDDLRGSETVELVGKKSVFGFSLKEIRQVYN